MFLHVGGSGVQPQMCIRSSNKNIHTTPYICYKNIEVVREEKDMVVWNIEYRILRKSKEPRHKNDKRARNKARNAYERRIKFASS